MQSQGQSIFNDLMILSMSTYYLDQVPFHDEEIWDIVDEDRPQSNQNLDRYDHLQSLLSSSISKARGGWRVENHSRIEGWKLALGPKDIFTVLALSSVNRTHVALISRADFILTKENSSTANHMFTSISSF